MINTLDHELFSFNKHSVPKVIEIGNCKNKLVIVEDLFLYPDKVREYALNATYFKDPTIPNNPGWQIPATGIDKVVFTSFLERQFNEIFGCIKFMGNLSGLSALFQIYNKKGRFVPHSDAALYAGVCSLNTEKENKEYENHTYFYRLKKTGQEYDIMNMYRQEFVNKTKPEDWEIYHKQLHKYNTYTFYEAQLFHNAFWNHDLEDHETPRVTFNTFSQ